MKLILFTLAFFFSTQFAKAELGESLQSTCETAETKALVGQNGSCRVVVAPKKVERSGFCRGKLLMNFSCDIFYSIGPGVSEVSLACGQAYESNPATVLPATATGFNAATFITSNDGVTEVKNDPNEYLHIKNDLIMMNIQDIKYDDALAPLIKGSVLVSLFDSWLPLTKVSCR